MAIIFASPTEKESDTTYGAKLITRDCYSNLHTYLTVISPISSLREKNVSALANRNG